MEESDTYFFVWRTTHAIHCARRLFHSDLHETTKINFQFLIESCPYVLLIILIISLGKARAGRLSLAAIGELSRDIIISLPRHLRKYSEQFHEKTCLRICATR